MNITLTNNCKIKYRPDQLELTRRILQRIPDKFLAGLSEIIFYDESNDPVVKYELREKPNGSSRINMFMGGFSKKGRYSTFHYNILLNGMIVSHIVHSLQPESRDPEILTIRPHRINHPEWMYLGIWSPFIVPLNFLSYLYRKSLLFRTFVDQRRAHVIDEVKTIK
jgi:hypothetical protein